MTPDGLAPYTYHLKERPRYDGELSGSIIKMLTNDGDVTEDNEWKYKNIETVSYKPSIVYLLAAAACPVITLSSFTTSSTEFVFTGSVAGAPGQSYGIQIEYGTTTATSDYGFSIVSGSGYTIDGDGDTTFNFSSNSGFGYGTFYAKATVTEASCDDAFSSTLSLTRTEPAGCVVSTTNNPIPSTSTDTWDRAALSGTVVDGSTVATIERGFVISHVNSDPLIGQSGTTSIIYGSSTSNGNYVMNISSSSGTLFSQWYSVPILQPATVHYVKAYGKGANGCIDYGDVKTMTLINSSSVTVTKSARFTNPVLAANSSFSIIDETLTDWQSFAAEESDTIDLFWEVQRLNAAGEDHPGSEDLPYVGQILYTNANLTVPAANNPQGYRHCIDASTGSLNYKVMEMDSAGRVDNYHTYDVYDSNNAEDAGY